MKKGDFVFDNFDKYGYVKKIEKGDVTYGEKHCDWVEDLIITTPENVMERYFTRIENIHKEIMILGKLAKGVNS